MKQFRLVDNIMGWLAFLVAAIVYCSTIEPTASFWDCPEFITTGYKLEIGHPPGAPFFMLTANLFSQFTSDPTQVARMVNTMSALLSAACILFLFWTITHLVRRLLINRWEELDLNKLIIIEGSGLVGALIYTFSDTFWFSAVEGEVYAYSSFFTAVVFWLILKWEDHADEPHSDRWLVLIMYMTGLSIGVHLLNLLCLPAIVLVYYYKRFPNANLKGSLLALLISFVLLAAILYGVIPGVVTVGGWFELFFVNTLHLPFNTGLIIYLILLIASVLWAIYETQMTTDKNWVRQNIAFLLGFGLLGVPFIGHGWTAFITGVIILAIVGALLFYRKHDKEAKSLLPIVSARLKNTTLLCMLMLMIGYSTYAVIVIRSSANPPMDQNSPEDIFSLGDYMSREQYGYTPLFYGQTYASEIVFEEPDEDGNRPAKKEFRGMEYKRKEKANPDEPDMYEEVEEDKRQKVRYVYHQNVFFPRMYSSEHKEQYENWLEGIHGREVDSQNGDGKITIPTFWDNMKFFFSYQVSYMYWRYFFWNFAGRQNDIQGHGESIHGNWITGISAIDNARLGDQSLLPDNLKKNKGHNVYYCLPLILGLIGLFWQMLGRKEKGVKQFWVVFFLFFMTGMAIVLYLNQTPSQPRERDYAYAGSFYAYAIWCGMGVAAIWDMARRYVQKTSTIIRHLIFIGISLGVGLFGLLWIILFDSVFLPAIGIGILIIGLVCLIVSLIYFLASIIVFAINIIPYKHSNAIAATVCGVVCLVVPIQMASQNWDDHDRSDRYTCRDFGQNYLMSLQDKDFPIIFTNGDNDTFPLWYNQDTEGVRTDVRVCNLSYLQTDWYTDQMLRPAYSSPAVPIGFTPYQYNNMPNYFIIDSNIKDAITYLRQVYRKEQIDELFGEDSFELKYILKYWIRDERFDDLKKREDLLKELARLNGVKYDKLVASKKDASADDIRKELKAAFKDKQKKTLRIAFDHFASVYEEEAKRAKMQGQNDYYDYYKEYASYFKTYKIDLRVFPTNLVYLDIDKEAVKKSGMPIPGSEYLNDYPEEERDSLLNELIPDRIEINVGKVLSGASNRYLGRSQIMMLDMLANANWSRPLYVAMTVGYDQYPGLHEYMTQEGLTYRITPFKNMRSLDTDRTYDRVMKHFKFGGVNTKGIYLDETVMRMCLTHRFLLTGLAQELIREDKADKAINVMKLIEKELPFYNVPCDYDNDKSYYSYNEAVASQNHPWTRSSALDMAKIYFTLAQIEENKADGKPALVDEFKKKGIAIINDIWKQTTDFTNYYMSMSVSMFTRNEQNYVYQIATELEILRILKTANLKAEYDQKKPTVEKNIDNFVKRGGGMHKAHYDEKGKYHEATYADLVLDTYQLEWSHDYYDDEYEEDYADEDYSDEDYPEEYDSEEDTDNDVADNEEL